MSGTRFVAVGDVMVDVTAAGSGHAAAIEVRAGGSAVNAALSAAAHGAAATVVGRVGDDVGGRAVRAALEEHGVRADLSVDPEAPTGTFLVVDGEIRADRGANARFEPAHVRQLEADVVLVSGYLPAETAAAAVERATAAWVALAPGLLDPLLDGADAVLVDETEARRLTGLDAEEAATVLGGSFRLACVTQAAAGAVAVLDGALETSSPQPLDGTGAVGAGDAFAASLLIAVAEGESLRDALATASRAGAAVVSGATR